MNKQKSCACLQHHKLAVLGWIMSCTMLLFWQVKLPGYSAMLFRHAPAILDSSLSSSVAVVQIKEAALELGYQADETFCLKISQLREIFVVRWSVFLLGPAGCGKSAIWKTLMRAQQNFGEKTFFKPINPKASQSQLLVPSSNKCASVRHCASTRINTKS